MTAQTYILRLLIFTAAICSAAVAFNYFVDPYSINGIERIEGFNKYKTEINSHVRLLKKYQPISEDVDALIIGNSRVEMGINPSHACISAGAWRAYNLGIPGAGVRQQLEYALNVIYQKPIRKVWLSIDFTDFLLNEKMRLRRLPELKEEKRAELRYFPSGEANPDYLQIKLTDYYKSLFSLDALISSFRTVLLQRTATTDRDLKGFNHARDFMRSVEVEGPAALFDQKIKVLQKTFDGKFYLTDSSENLGPSFTDIDQFLAIATGRNIQVTLFTNPFHEYYWALMRQYELMKLHEIWLEKIEELVAKYDRSEVSLWNFSADSPYIHEPVPERGIKSGPLQWFWEPAHYREQLGDLMISAMTAKNCGVSADFGIKLH